MTSLRLSQVRRKVAGSLANTFQKLLIQSVLRVALMSSKTARTSGLAALSSISGTAGIVTSYQLAIPVRRNSPPIRPARKRPSMRKSLNSDQIGWEKVSGRLRSKAACASQAGA